MLRKYTSSPWIAIALTSVLFALTHWGAAPQTVPALFVLSVALGYNYERTGRLVSPLVIHAVFNAVYIGIELCK